MEPEENILNIMDIKCLRYTCEVMHIDYEKLESARGN